MLREEELVEKNTPTDRWAMVTGSSRGIGRSTALVLAREGWNIGLHYCQSQSSVESVQREIEGLGRQSFVLHADFRDWKEGSRLVDDAWKSAGRIDAWVHLAGADTLTGDAGRWSFEQKLDQLVAVDLMATMVVCRSVGARMREQGAGSIVTIGWDQASTGMEGDSGELFAAVKGGVAAFSRSLAKSLAPIVRVNCVAPGWIKTAWGEGASEYWHNRVREETPLGRWGEAADIAACIAFLISPSADFVTGQTINVNGGAVTS